MSMSRKLARTLKTSRTRNLSRNPYREIERIWAEHGVVRILNKDGQSFTKTARQAAYTAKQLNDGLPPEGFTSRKHILKLIDDLIAAIREARAQQETPKDLTDATITKALHEHYTYDLNDSPELVAKIKQKAFLYPHLDRDEIRIVLKKEGMTDKLADDMMREVNKVRMDQLARGILPKPDIFS